MIDQYNTRGGVAKNATLNFERISALDEEAAAIQRVIDKENEHVTAIQRVTNALR